MIGQLEEEIARRITPIIVRALEKASPTITAAAARAASAAEPTMRKVIREEVMPKLLTYGIIGFLAVGALAAIIGAAMARR